MTAFEERAFEEGIKLKGGHHDKLYVNEILIRRGNFDLDIEGGKTVWSPQEMAIFIIKDERLQRNQFYQYIDYRFKHPQS